MSWRIMWASLAALVITALVARDQSGGTATWDMARAAGFVAYFLLWVAVFTGAGSNLRFHPGIGKQAIVWELHRGSATLGLSFAGAHVVALLFDPWVGYGPLDVLIGLTSDYRPVQVSLGALAMWLMLTVVVSTAYGGYFSKAGWRGLHYLAYPAYMAALVHSLTAGSDIDEWPTHVYYTFTVGALAAALFLRFFGRSWVEPHPVQED